MVYKWWILFLLNPLCIWCILRYLMHAYIYFFLMRLLFLIHRFLKISLFDWPVERLIFSPRFKRCFTFAFYRLRHFSHTNFFLIVDSDFVKIILHVPCSRSLFFTTGVYCFSRANWIVSDWLQAFTISRWWSWVCMRHMWRYLLFLMTVSFEFQHTILIFSVFIFLKLQININITETNWVENI